MYVQYKKDKCPNQMKINYISYNKIKPTIKQIIVGQEWSLAGLLTGQVTYMKSSHQ